MTTTTGSSIDDNAKVDNALQHLPPRKRLAAQMMSHAPSSTTSSDPTSRTAKKRSTSSSGGGENDEDAAALFARYKKMYANRKPSSRVCLLPESDRVREARARAALAAGELPPAAVEDEHSASTSCPQPDALDHIYPRARIAMPST